METAFRRRDSTFAAKGKDTTIALLNDLVVQGEASRSTRSSSKETLPKLNLVLNLSFVAEMW